MRKLENKVAVVTGGAGDIGKETGKLFLQNGAKVCLVDISLKSLDKVKAELEQYGEVIIIQADVSEEPQVKNYVNEVIKHFGTVDVFFNNAGIMGDFDSIIDQSVANFDKVISVNLRGVFLGLKYILPIMKDNKGGSVINTSSNAGWGGAANISAYAASKHAVVGLTKTAALEMANDNVRVNSIQPSNVYTKMTRSLEEDMSPNGTAEIRKEMEQKIPLGKYAEVIDVAKLVLFLASDDSSFITGSQYRIDGGLSASSN